MPHQCTGCGHAFEDGSKEMLGGCPDCGGNKFQFYPAGTDVPEQPPGDAEPPEPPEAEGSAVASKVGRATTKVRDFVSSDAPAPDDAHAPADGPATTDADAADAGSVDADAAEAGAAGAGAATSTNPDADGDPDPDAPWPDAGEDPPVSGGESGDSDIIDADARATERALEEAEDAAQADARTGVVSESEVEAARPEDEPGVADGDQEAGVAGADDGALAAAEGQAASGDGSADGDAPVEAGPPAGDGTVVREPTGEEPDLAELREQLNDQFESIKILEPGQYELNLMELYDRDEYIIALQENGRYVIQVPENFMGDRPAE